MSSARAARSRRRLILVIIAAVILLVLVISGTWVLARRAQSPAQRDAAAAPPSPAAVTVTVRTGDLRDEVTATGTIAAAGQHRLVLPTRSDADLNVITASETRIGQPVVAGQVLLRVNSRPVIILHGAFTPYRDLYVGDTGDDVRELQAALAELGYDVAADGKLGAATAHAVKRLYASVDATAPTSSTTTGVPGAGQADSSTAAQGSSTGGGADSSAGRSLVMPRAEMLMAPSLDQSTALVQAPTVGTVLTDDNAQIIISSGQRQVTAELPATVAEALTPGTTAAHAKAGTSELSLVLDSLTVQDEQAGTSNGGGAQGTGGSAITGATYDAVFTTSDTDLGALGPDAPDTILLTIERSPAVADALLVPERAVVRAADATATVLKRRTATEFDSVPVEVSTCVGGTCAITSSQLTTGDVVRVDGR